MARSVPDARWRRTCPRHRNFIPVLEKLRITSVTFARLVDKVNSPEAMGSWTAMLGTGLLLIYATVGASVLMHCYMWFGYQYFSIPIPDVIAPALHLYRAARFEAVQAEIWLEFWLSVALLLFAMRWAIRKSSS
jgi:hypothetical protein